MFAINIQGQQVLFGKFFSGKDAADALVAIRAAGASRAVFVDCPATEHLVAVLRTLREEGCDVLVRDHHDVAGDPATDRDCAIRAAVEGIRNLLGEQAVISTRAAHPACSLLIRAGEFVDKLTPHCGGWDCHGPQQPSTYCGNDPQVEGDGCMQQATVTTLVADNDADGLLGCLKAAGIVWPELDSDAAVLDGPRAEQTAERLSPFALLLVRGLATLPPYDAARPQVAEDAKRKLFADFADAAAGDAEARTRLEANVAAYEAAVEAAEAAAGRAIEPMPGVVLADIVGAGKVDLSTLAARLDARPGARVTVVRKDNGPIAGLHGGVQYSLAVPKALQQEINLQELLPAGQESSPVAGLISNTTFLLHVSERLWTEMVLPALVERFPRPFAMSIFNNFFLDRNVQKEIADLMAAADLPEASPIRGEAAIAPYCGGWKVKVAQRSAILESAEQPTHLAVIWRYRIEGRMVTAVPCKSSRADGDLLGLIEAGEVVVGEVSQDIFFYHPAGVFPRAVHTGGQDGGTASLYGFRSDVVAWRRQYAATLLRSAEHLESSAE